MVPPPGSDFQHVARIGPVGAVHPRDARARRAAAEGGLRRGHERVQEDRLLRIRRKGRVSTRRLSGEGEDKIYVVYVYVIIYMSFGPS